MTKKKKKRASKKRKKKKEREKKRVYKKGGVRKEESESEPAGSTLIEGYLMCTPSSCGITLQQKNISPPGSTQPCSRVLAKPCHNSHLLPALHSVASSPNARKRKGILLLRSRALLLHLVWHMLICKERRHTLHLQSQSIVPTDQATMVHGFYTLVVCTTWP